TSPQSTNQNMSDRTMDTPTTSNGGNNYGHTHSSSSSSSHSNALQSCTPGNYA
ncbi:unnamed protein product, partial [Rotaria socialis]